MRSYAGPFILTFFIALFILLMQFVWKYIDELVGKGLEWFIILKLLGLVSVTLISLALPLAILLSSLMTFGNLGEYNELSALKAAGISLPRIMSSVFIFCMLLSVTAFYFSNNVLPVANLKMRTLLHDISNKRPELNIKPGIFNSTLENYVLRIGQKSKDGRYLTDIMIYDHSNRQGNDRLIIAEKGEMMLSEDQRYLELRLQNGHTYTETEPNRKRSNKYPFLRENFKEDLIRFDLSLFKMNKSDEGLFKRNYQMLNLNQLRAAADTLNMQIIRDKSNLSGVLFNGPFFDLTRKYSTVYKEEFLPGMSLDSTLDSGDEINNDSLSNSRKGLKSKLEFASRMMVASGMKDSSKLITSQPLVIDTTALVNYSTSTPIKRKTLKNKKEVMENYSKSDRIRILEAASSIIRSNKNTLEYSHDALVQEQERVNRYWVEWHRKFTLSFACLVLFLVGAPLGAIVRKGGLGLPVVFSVVFFMTYHMISITGEKLAREGVLTPFGGMWLSTFILLPFGLFLTYKAANDSALFDKDSWLKIFKRKTYRIN